MKKTKYNIFDWRTLISLAVLVGLGLLVMSAIDSRKAARISGLEVEILPLEGMTYLIQQEEVKNIIYEGYRRDVGELTLQNVDIAQIEQVLESEPFIGNADVFIQADRVLSIRVKQSKPAIRIMDNQGQAYYLTIEGTAFPVSRHASARVPVFTGDIPTFGSVGDTLTTKQSAIVDIMHKIAEDQFAQKMIEQVHVNTKGEFYIQPKLGKFKFKLGTPTQLEDKMERFELAYKEIIPQKGWTRYRTIDLSFDDQIICKK
ncbi:MAG: cell division protein FtsQ/DivIB [Bacteroidia bacterium]|nr:cell division protein FtsQ/DivIB [Bacteroidia bacterium]